MNKLCELMKNLHKLESIYIYREHLLSWFWTKTGNNNSKHVQQRSRHYSNKTNKLHEATLTYLLPYWVVTPAKSISGQLMKNPPPITVASNDMITQSRTIPITPNLNFFMMIPPNTIPPAPPRRVTPPVWNRNGTFPSYPRRLISF